MEHTTMFSLDFWQIAKLMTTLWTFEEEILLIVEFFVWNLITFFLMGGDLW
jgi:hypothetical protein